MLHKGSILDRVASWIAEEVVRSVVAAVLAALTLATLVAAGLRLLSWFRSAHEVYGWAIAALVVLAIWGLVAAGLQGRAWRESRKLIPYEVYRKDTVLGVTWRWEWRRPGTAKALTAYCPSCDMLMKKRLPRPCPSCGWEWENWQDIVRKIEAADPVADDFEDCVVLEIERRARSGEWREALAMQEDEPPSLSSPSFL